MTKRLVMLAAVMALAGGCSSSSSTSSSSARSQVYLHDAGLERQLKDAKARFEEISKGTGSIWAASTANLSKAAELKRDAIVRSGEAKFAAHMNALSSMSWNEVRSKATEVSYRDLLTKEIAKSKKLAEELGELKTLVEADPGVPLAPGHAGSPELGTVNEEFAKVEKDQYADLAKVQAYLQKVTEAADLLEQKIVPALDGYIDDEPLNKLIAVLRKANHPALLQTVELLRGDDQAAVPGVLKDALKKYLDVNISTLGELRAMLKPEASGIYEIRLTLLDEARRATGEFRKVQLGSLKRKLALSTERSQILMDMMDNAAKIDAQVSQQGSDFQSKPVVGWLETTTASARDEKDATRRGALRDTLANNLNLLVLYANLTGSLDMSRRLNEESINDVEHAERNDLDRVAAEAHARLVDLGLEGTVAFAEGGVTEEQIANWLRTAQTAALAAIGAGVN